MSRLNLRSISLVLLVVLSAVTGASAQEAADKPATPTGFKATAVSDTEIKVSWDKVDGLTYVIKRSLSKDRDFLPIKLVEPGVDKEGLLAGTKYYYQLTAEAGDAKSEAATTEATTGPPPAPKVADQSVEVDEDTKKEFSVDVTYSGDPKNLKYKLVAKPENGTVADEGDPTKVVYEPSKNFIGSDSFKLKVEDTTTDKTSGEVTVSVKVGAAATPVDQIVEAIKGVAPGQYDPDTIRSSTQCKLVLKGKDNGQERYEHVCDPAAIAVSTIDPSTVILELPRGVTKVRATANVNWKELKPKHEKRRNLANYQEAVFDGTSPPPGKLFINLIQYRYFGSDLPDPESAKNEKSRQGGNVESGQAKSGCDNPCAGSPDLSLVVPGKGAPEWLKIDISWKDKKGSHSYTLEVRLLYFNWFVDIAGFYGLQFTGDQELVTTTLPGEPVDGDPGQPMTQVLRIRDPSESSVSGVMLHFFKSAYPKWAVAFGLAFPADRSPSYYLGAGRRLLHIGKSAVVTFSAGVAASQVRAFPGIEAEKSYDANFPLLNGELQYEIRPFASVTLGFQVPNKPSGSK